MIGNSTNVGRTDYTRNACRTTFRYLWICRCYSIHIVRAKNGGSLYSVKPIFLVNSTWQAHPHVGYLDEFNRIAHHAHNIPLGFYWRIGQRVGIVIYLVNFVAIYSASVGRLWNVEIRQLQGHKFFDDLIVAPTLGLRDG